MPEKIPFRRFGTMVDMSRNAVMNIDSGNNGSMSLQIWVTTR